MQDDMMLSEAAQRVMMAIYQQLGEEITRSDLRDQTGLTDSDLLAALSELQRRHWIEHTGYPGNPSGDRWRITALGQSAGPHKPVDPAISRTLEDTIVLHPPRDRGLIRALWIAGLLYALLLVGVAIGWTWLAIFLILFVGVWIGLLFTCLIRWSEVVRLTPTTLITRSWYGRQHETPRESIAQIVLVSVHPGNWSRGGPSRYLLFLDMQNHCLNWLLTANIPIDAQKAFARQCGVPLRDLSRERVRLKELERAFPGTTAGRTTAMGLTILGAALLGLAITILLILIVSGVFGSL